MEVLKLDDYRPLKEVAKFTLYTDHKGKPQLVLTDADPEWIESLPSISSRFEKLGLMCMDGAAFLRRQAKHWKKQGD